MSQARQQLELLFKADEEKVADIELNQRLTDLLQIIQFDFSAIISWDFQNANYQNTNIFHHVLARGSERLINVLYTQFVVRQKSASSLEEKNAKTIFDLTYQSEHSPTFFEYAEHPCLSNRQSVVMSFMLARLAELNYPSIPLALIQVTGLTWSDKFSLLKRMLKPTDEAKEESIGAAVLNHYDFSITDHKGWSIADYIAQNYLQAAGGVILFVDVLSKGATFHPNNKEIIAKQSISIMQKLYQTYMTANNSLRLSDLSPGIQQIFLFCRDLLLENYSVIWANLYKNIKNIWIYFFQESRGSLEPIIKDILLSSENSLIKDVLSEDTRCALSMLYFKQDPARLQHYNLSSLPPSSMLAQILYVIAMTQEFDLFTEIKKDNNLIFDGAGWHVTAAECPALQDIAWAEIEREEKDFSVGSAKRINLLTQLLGISGDRMHFEHGPSFLYHESGDDALHKRYLARLQQEMKIVLARLSHNAQDPYPAYRQDIRIIDNLLICIKPWNLNNKAHPVKIALLKQLGDYYMPTNPLQDFPDYQLVMQYWSSIFATHLFQRYFLAEEQISLPPQITLEIEWCQPLKGMILDYLANIKDPAAQRSLHSKLYARKSGEHSILQCCWNYQPHWEIILEVFHGPESSLLQDYSSENKPENLCQLVQTWVAGEKLYLTESSIYSSAKGCRVTLLDWVLSDECACGTEAALWLLANGARYTQPVKFSPAMLEAVLKFFATPPAWMIRKYQLLHELPVNFLTLLVGHKSELEEYLLKLMERQQTNIMNAELKETLQLVEFCLRGSSYCCPASDEKGCGIVYRNNFDAAAVSSIREHKLGIDACYVIDPSKRKIFYVKKIADNPIIVPCELKPPCTYESLTAQLALLLKRKELDSKAEARFKLTSAQHPKVMALLAKHVQPEASPYSERTLPCQLFGILRKGLQLKDGEIIFAPGNMPGSSRVLGALAQALKKLQGKITLPTASTTGIFSSLNVEKGQSSAVSPSSGSALTWQTNL